MQTYLVRFYDGRYGTGQWVSLAMKSFMNPEEFESFIKSIKHHRWSQYISKTIEILKPTKGKKLTTIATTKAKYCYESCTITDTKTGIQLAEIYRSYSPEAIRILERQSQSKG